MKFRLEGTLSGSNIHTLAGIKKILREHGFAESENLEINNDLKTLKKKILEWTKK